MITNLPIVCKKDFSETSFRSFLSMPRITKPEWAQEDIGPPLHSRSTLSRVTKRTWQQDQMSKKKCHRAHDGRSDTQFNFEYMMEWVQKIEHRQKRTKAAAYLTASQGVSQLIRTAPLSRLIFSFLMWLSVSLWWTRFLLLRPLLHVAPVLPTNPRSKWFQFRWHVRKKHPNSAPKRDHGRMGVS